MSVFRSGKFVWDDATKCKYLENLEANGQQGKAAKHVGTTSLRVTNERKADKEFDQAFQECILLFRESCEDELRRRAIDGVEEPVFYQGVETATQTRYSDSLLQFYMKANDPKYKDKLKVDTVVSGGVLLTAAIPSTAKAWLESMKPKQLPSAENELDESNILDVGSVADPIPV